MGRWAISGLRLKPGEGEERLRSLAAEKLGVGVEAIHSLELIRRSLDARGRRPPFFECAAAVELQTGVEPSGEATPWRPRRYRVRTATMPPPLAPVVVGAGPAGLFTALRLTEYGLKPVLVEQGKPVAERVRDVARYWRGGILDPVSNVLFGEGGAGTYSDGKLTTRIKDFRKSWVLERFVEAGADPSILADAKPHLGTDRLRGIVERLRGMLLARGASIRFGFKVDRLMVAAERAAGVEGPEGRVPAHAVFLASGHSSRALYRALAAQGVALAAKGFALGLRLEVAQAAVDRRQYGPWCGEPGLPSAEFVVKARAGDGRGVYSFCMCPGGVIIPTGSEAHGTVVNGMSGSRRSGRFANAALVVETHPADFGNDPLRGLDYQRHFEEAAFALAGARALPAQRVAAFGKKGAGTLPEAASSPWPLRATELSRCLPDFASAALAECLPALARDLPPLSSGILVGVETRTSSPVRIERDEAGESLTLPGLYPVGEGAGYAGGIMSSAVDGARAADRYASLLGGCVDEGEEEEA